MRATLSILATLIFLASMHGSCLAVQQVGGPQSSAIERAKQKVLERGSYETVLPNRKPAARERPPKWFSWLMELAPFAGIIVRILFVFFVIFMVVHLTREFQSRRARRRRGERTVSAGEVIRGADFNVDMAEIRDLAARGQYSEAIHALLLRTVQELCRLADIEIRPSKTSREITREIPLEDVPRQDLTALVTATEISHFGSEPATVEDYEACMGHFDSFVRALGGEVS